MAMPHLHFLTVKEEKMRVAIVSSDGKVINQHFGKASRFLIFEVDDGKIQYIEERKNIPVCGSAETGHADNALNRTIALISDCQTVLCSRIGGGAEEELKRNGIISVETTHFIHEALREIK
ncbi:MAG: dinitrogenase iron-molybdenum cofactor biosynthesis protein [Candidatus Methanoperedenaceae archaeon]|nr:MAG: dinitrogenase iron-molybdenum cofactor biosynthesis protein [Candidatus Methanoperedenaceae archaeon]